MKTYCIELFSSCTIIKWFCFVYFFNNVIFFTFFFTEKVKFYESRLNSISPPSVIPKIDPTFSFLLALRPTLRKLDEQRRLRIQQEFIQVVEEAMIDQKDSE